MKILKTIITTVFLSGILYFTFSHIIPTSISTLSDIQYRPEVNTWKLIFYLVQLLTAIYLFSKGIQFIFEKSKAN